MAEINYKVGEKILKAVANARRLKILSFLKKNREATVGAVAEQIKLSFKSTSRHLALLYSAGILDKEQRGIEVYYSLSTVQHSTIKHTISIL